MELGDPGCLLCGAGQSINDEKLRLPETKDERGAGADFYESWREEAGARAASWGLSERALVRILHNPGSLLGMNLDFWPCGLDGDLLSLRAEWPWVPGGGRNSTEALMKTDLPPSWCGTCHCRVETVTSGDVSWEKTGNRRHRTSPPAPTLPVCTSFLAFSLACEGTVLPPKGEGRRGHKAWRLSGGSAWAAAVEGRPDLPPPSQIALPGHPGATAVPFPWNDPNQVFGNKRLQLYLNTLLQVVNSHPHRGAWAPG